MTSDGTRMSFFRHISRLEIYLDFKGIAYSREYCPKCFHFFGCRGSVSECDPFEHFSNRQSHFYSTKDDIHSIRKKITINFAPFIYFNSIVKKRAVFWQCLLNHSNRMVITLLCHFIASNIVYAPPKKMVAKHKKWTDDEIAWRKKIVKSPRLLTQRS